MESEHDSRDRRNGRSNWCQEKSCPGEADIVTIHLVLSTRTAGLMGAAELALIKPAARLINTPRGPIVDERSLIEALPLPCNCRSRDRRLRSRNLPLAR